MSEKQRSRVHGTEARVADGPRPGTVEAPAGSMLDLYTLSGPDDSSAAARFAPLDPHVIRTALALLTQIVGLPLAAIDLAPPHLSVAFPKGRMPDAARAVLGAQMPRYHAWRRILLDAQMLAMRKPVDDDAWDGLRRVTRLTISANAADAIGVAARYFPGEPPSSITHRRAVAVEAGLTRLKGCSFRRAIKIILDLHGHELAGETELLPPIFDPLPPRSRFQGHLQLPAGLRAAVATASTAERMSLAYFWTIAVRTGEFCADADPTIAEVLGGGRWNRLCAIDPNPHGVALTRGSWRAYMHRARRLLAAAGAPDPRVGTVAEAWAVLAKLAREAGISADRLSPLAASAKKDGLRPTDVTPVWVAERLTASQNMKRERALRGACLVFDTLRSASSIPGYLLPASQTGVLRVRRRRGDPVPASTARPRNVDPLEHGWIALFAALRRAGASDNDVHPAYAVRAEAKRQGRAPLGLDRIWFEETRSGLSRQTAIKFGQCARLFDRFRAHPDLRDHLPEASIGALDDRRRSADDLAPTISAELDRLLDRQGAAASTRRQASIAVRAAAEALARHMTAGRPSSLSTILSAPLEDLNWGGHASRTDDHMEVLARLRAFEDLPWTPAWRRLQAAVVSAGVAMRDNPIPALLRRADGRDPAELDSAWAVEIDSGLRRAVRFDLARTFAAATHRLDALHDVPALARSGLLPPGSARFASPDERSLPRALQSPTRSATPGPPSPPPFADPAAGRMSCR